MAEMALDEHADLSSRLAARLAEIHQMLYVLAIAILLCGYTVGYYLKRMFKLGLLCFGGCYGICRDVRRRAKLQRIEAVHDSDQVGEARVPDLLKLNHEEMRRLAKEWTQQERQEYIHLKV